MVVFLILNVTMKPTKADRHSEWYSYVLTLVGPYSEAPHHGISRIYRLPQQNLHSWREQSKLQAGEVLSFNRQLPLREPRKFYIRPGSGGAWMMSLKSTTYYIK